ncbi:S-layer homology domain-containing protein [Fodinisporobacter ferrooxydans]|uniref:S-layer homology domain-containing protein n=1 Tax=Fodinisporobacter ferrooxydans TaxID=2901836 RepID=A0ABY4CS05_9BACL|nr:S-layer homology domain-containing protein [Alicyclobacillaceae bacterium MYW30-H2]
MVPFSRSIFTVTLSGLLAVSPLMYPTHSKADTSISIGQTFTDVSTSYWAYPNILKMSLRHVVTGFQDGTFHPDEKVTQLQAIVMAIRNMGLSDQLANANTANLPYNVPDWGKPYVAIAIDKGLIIPSENRFDPNQNASREWVAELMVRMIGKSAATVSTAAGTPTSFTDSSSISDWAKGYVQEAADSGLITGYQDPNGYSFRPQQEVTRAEMVTLLSNGEKYLNIETNQTHLGTLQSLTDSSLTIADTASGTSYTFNLNGQTQFFDHNQAISKSAIQPFSQLLVIGDNTQAYYVEVKGTSTNTVIDGTVQKVYPEVKSIVLKDAQNKIVTYQYDANLQLKSTAGTLSDVSLLANGDTVQATVDPSGKIVELVRTGQSANTSLDGTVYDIDKTNSLITIQTSDNQITAYQYNSDTYVNYKGKRFPTINDLQKGDHVQLQVSQGIVTSITVNEQQSTGSTGTVAVIMPNQQFIAIQGSDSQIHSYQVSANANVTFADGSTGSLSDIQKGDTVQVTTDSNGNATGIAVTNRNGGQSAGVLTGVVNSVDTTDQILTLQDSQGNLHAYEMSPNAVYIINGVANPGINDVKKDMTVSLQLDQNNKVIYLNADSSVNGTIVKVDPANNLLTVKLDTGETKLYVVDPSVNIYIHNIYGDSLSNLHINDNVSLNLTGQKITEIDVQRSYVDYVTNVDPNSSQLTVQDSSNSNNSQILSLDGSVTLTVPGVSYPTLSNIKAGESVKVTYSGDTLKSIAVLPSQVVKINAVDTANQNLVVQSGSQTPVTIAYSAIDSILDPNQQAITESSLNVGDEAMLAGSADTGYYLQVLKRVDGIFLAMDPLGDRIYILGNSYYLPTSYFNNNPNAQTFLQSLQRLDKVSIYFLNDQIYDIEKTN